MLIMEDAPKDGTRILVLSEITEALPNSFKTKVIGSKWVEAWYYENRWALWCGAPDRRCTEFLQPIGWMPLPEKP